MYIEKNNVVSIRYIMKNDSGEVLENTMHGDPVRYIHGGSNILPDLQGQLEGLQPGDRKPVYLFEEGGNGGRYFVFDVIVDSVRAAQPEEIFLGYPVLHTEACGPGCDCYQ